MTEEPYISIKWPGLLVSGETVTEDQAAEILVRTAHWPLMSNARRIDALYNEIAGIPDWRSEAYTYEKNAEAREALGILPLNYLYNCQITSSYIGGPYGWCDWRGQIFCNAHNIGKWPSLEEVTEEWEAIAHAFPFLHLTAQVIDDEIDGDGDPVPTAEWYLREGKVHLSAPGKLLVPIRKFDPEAISRSLDLDPEIREVGATEAQLRRGVELAQQTVLRQQAAATI